ILIIQPFIYYYCKYYVYEMQFQFKMTYSFKDSTVLSPNPFIFFISSIDLKSPFASLYFIIASALLGPILCIFCICSLVVLLIFTSTFSFLLLFLFKFEGIFSPFIGTYILI